MNYFQVICCLNFFLAALGPACLADELANSSEPPSFRAEVEANLVWQGRNEVRVPSSGGTTFSLKDFGQGPDFTDRVSLSWNINSKHGLKLMIFPFATKGNATPTQPIQFQGTTFAAGVATESRYKFHSYRLTYRYTFIDEADWRFKFGVTAKIRNAQVSLKQGTVSAEKNDVGFVPLLHFNLAYFVSPDWRIEFDADALVAPQGRAEDLSLFAWYRFSPRWESGFGYRTLEGGADNSSVYTFAWLHFASVLVAFEF